MRGKEKAVLGGKIKWLLKRLKKEHERMFPLCFDRNIDFIVGSFSRAYFDIIESNKRENIGRKDTCFKTKREGCS